MHGRRPVRAVPLGRTLDPNVGLGGLPMLRMDRRAPDVVAEAFRVVETKCVGLLPRPFFRCQGV